LPPPLFSPPFQVHDLQTKSGIVPWIFCFALQDVFPPTPNCLWHLYRPPPSPLFPNTKNGANPSGSSGNVLSVMRPSFRSGWLFFPFPSLPLYEDLPLFLIVSRFLKSGGKRQPKSPPSSRALFSPWPFSPLRGLFSGWVVFSTMGRPSGVPSSSPPSSVWGDGKTFFKESQPPVPVRPCSSFPFEPRWFFAIFLQ